MPVTLAHDLHHDHDHDCDQDHEDYWMKNFVNLQMVKIVFMSCHARDRLLMIMTWIVRVIG